MSSEGEEKKTNTCSDEQLLTLHDTKVCLARRGTMATNEIDSIRGLIQGLILSQLSKDDKNGQIEYCTIPRNFQIKID